MKTAAATGGLGDIIYSIPVLKQLGVECLAVKQIALENGSDTYTALKDLIELQGLQCIPTNGNYPMYEFEPGLQVDVNIDNFRNQPARGKNHIIKSMMAEFGCFINDWKRPWLNIGEYHQTLFDYTVIAVTPRWRERSRVNWKKVVNGIYSWKFFLGFRTDYEAFIQKYSLSGADITYLPTANMLEVARYIFGANAVYCNQSPFLALSQAVGVPYYLEKKPLKTNVLMYTQNEHIL